MPCPLHCAYYHSLVLLDDESSLPQGTIEIGLPKPEPSPCTLRGRAASYIPGSVCKRVLSPGSRLRKVKNGTCLGTELWPCCLVPPLDLHCKIQSSTLLPNFPYLAGYLYQLRLRYDVLRQSHSRRSSLILLHCQTNHPFSHPRSARNYSQSQRTSWPWVRITKHWTSCD